MHYIVAFQKENFQFSEFSYSAFGKIKVSEVYWKKLIIRSILNGIGDFRLIFLDKWIRQHGNVYKNNMKSEASIQWNFKKLILSFRFCYRFFITSY